MKRNWLAWSLVIVLILVLVVPVLAQIGGGFDLSWFTEDGGGGASTGGVYTLHGTAGQADPGMLAGGPYTLAGGFWGGGGIPALLYLPSVQR